MTCLSLVVTRRKGAIVSMATINHPHGRKKTTNTEAPIVSQPTSKPLNPTLYTPVFRCRQIETAQCEPPVPQLEVGRTKPSGGNKVEKKKKPTQESHTPPISMHHAMRPSPNSSMPCNPFHAYPPDAVVGIPSEPSKSIIIPTPDHAERKKKASNASRESSPFFVALLKLPSQSLPLSWVARTFVSRWRCVGGRQLACFCELSQTRRKREREAPWRSQETKCR